ncbi:hypothetical protein Tco_0786577 [Tanacetum coccineum]
MMSRLPLDVYSLSFEALKDRDGEGVSLEEGCEDWGFDSNEEEVVPKVNDVSLVDGVFEGAFGVNGDEDFVMGKGGGLSRSHGSRRKKEEDDGEDDE